MATNTRCPVTDKPHEREYAQTRCAWCGASLCGCRGMWHDSDCTLWIEADNELHEQLTGPVAAQEVR